MESGKRKRALQFADTGAVVWGIGAVKRLREQRVVGTGSPLALSSPETRVACHVLQEEPPLRQPPTLGERVYMELWRRGFWVTDGFKFGCDFLAYEGDPLVYHASLMVLLLGKGESLRPRQLCSHARVATGVKKKALVVAERDDGELAFFSVKWKGVS